jgi:large subunit ribosomal protein L4
MQKVNIKIFNKQGDQIGTMELDSPVFSESAKPELIYQVVKVAESKIRQPLAHTKDRGDVRGGGKKPWKQKGTGRARHGSIRSPLWKGGGVTFGPRVENFTKLTIPRKMVQKAIRAVISDKIKHDNFYVIEDFIFEKPSTKLIIELISKLNLSGKKVLIFTDDRMGNTILSSRNVPKVSPLRLENLNIMDILINESILIDKTSLDALVKHLSK